MHEACGGGCCRRHLRAGHLTYETVGSAAVGIREIRALIYEDEDLPAWMWRGRRDRLDPHIIKPGRALGAAVYVPQRRSDSDQSRLTGIEHQTDVCPVVRPYERLRSKGTAVNRQVCADFAKRVERGSNVFSPDPPRQQIVPVRLQRDRLLPTARDLHVGGQIHSEAAIPLMFDTGIQRRRTRETESTRKEPSRRAIRSVRRCPARNRRSSAGSGRLHRSRIAAP